MVAQRRRDEARRQAQRPGPTLLLLTTYECSRVDPMALSKKLTRLEMQIMETLWSKGAASIREIQEAFPEPGRPAYTTIQTTVYRLEFKKVVWRSKKVSNAH